MTKCFLLCGVPLLLSGCASTFESISNRAVMSDHLDEPHDRNKVRSQTGDRRTFIFLERPGDNRLVICGEPFAGAISGRGASSGVTVTGKAELSDAVTTALLAVDQRAAPVRLYEVASYEYCKRYQDGTLTTQEYRTALKDMTEKAFAALAPKAADAGDKKTAGESKPAESK